VIPCKTGTICGGWNDLPNTNKNDYNIVTKYVKENVMKFDLVDYFYVPRDLFRKSHWSVLKENHAFFVLLWCFYTTDPLSTDLFEMDYEEVAEALGMRVKHVKEGCEVLVKHKYLIEVQDGIRINWGKYG
jgi:hypothetical protein